MCLSLLIRLFQMMCFTESLYIEEVQTKRDTASSLYATLRTVESYPKQALTNKQCMPCRALICWQLKTAPDPELDPWRWFVVEQPKISFAKTPSSATLL